MTSLPAQSAPDRVIADGFGKNVFFAIESPTYPPPLSPGAWALGIVLTSTASTIVVPHGVPHGVGLEELR